MFFVATQTNKKTNKQVKSDKQKGKQEQNKNSKFRKPKKLFMFMCFLEAEDAGAEPKKQEKQPKAPKYFDA